MIKALRTQFVIADGARARWVTRSDHADDFVTTMDRKAEPLLHGETGATLEGAEHYTMPPPEHATREHHARFARELAEEINVAARNGGFDRLVVVAPDRTLAEITQHLKGAATEKLAGTLAKDLTKTPDHELMAWLRPLEHG
ncbi:host attachment protein [Phenylobacterium montanum]|uniref:Host attachment protein n=1 Tax=Phenylobacterium montanum TaxID=2823693 RepID=A0A975FYZ1_9CAUL|nr:host attachment protein [Caulobacter sp. S6]QUD87756.1 host attachment protein [Caulobacter sp. S6]